MFQITHQFFCHGPVVYSSSSSPLQTGCYPLRSTPARRPIYTFMKIFTAGRFIFRGLRRNVFREGFMQCLLVRKAALSWDLSDVPSGVKFTHMVVCLVCVRDSEMGQTQGNENRNK